MDLVREKKEKKARNEILGALITIRKQKCIYGRDMCRMGRRFSAFRRAVRRVLLLASRVACRLLGTGGLLWLH